MPNSWDVYYEQYTDWDDAHCFNVRIELRYEKELIALGYVQKDSSDDIFNYEKEVRKSNMPEAITYQKNLEEILLTFQVPYDWSIDSDWEDRALSLLGLNEEWVIDSAVEDY